MIAGRFLPQTRHAFKASSFVRHMHAWHTQRPFGSTSASISGLGGNLYWLLFFAPALVLGGAATHLSGFSPRVRQMSAFSVARFQLLTLRLNTLHDWLLMNHGVAKYLAERDAAIKKDDFEFVTHMRMAWAIQE